MGFSALPSCPWTDKYLPQRVQCKATLRWFSFDFACSFIILIHFLNVLFSFLLMAGFFLGMSSLFKGARASDAKVVSDILISTPWGLFQGTVGAIDFQGARCRARLCARLQPQLFSFELAELSVVVSKSAINLLGCFLPQCAARHWAIACKALLSLADTSSLSVSALSCSLKGP